MLPGLFVYTRLESRVLRFLLGGVLHSETAVVDCERL